MAGRKKTGDEAEGAAEAGAERVEQANVFGDLEACARSMGGVQTAEALFDKLDELSAAGRKACAEIDEGVPDAKQAGLRAAAPRQFQNLQAAKRAIDEAQSEKNAEPKPMVQGLALPPMFWPILFQIARQVIAVLEERFKPQPQQV